MVRQDLPRSPVLSESLVKYCNGVLCGRRIEDTAAGNEPGRIVNKCDNPTFGSVNFELFSVPLPQRHRMSPFVADILPLFAFLHVHLNKPVREKDTIDPVVRDVDPACLFDLFLKMNGTEIVLVI